MQQGGAANDGGWGKCSQMDFMRQAEASATISEARARRNSPAGCDDAEK